MLDNLRNQATFQPDEDEEGSGRSEQPKPEKTHSSFDRITGTTDKQRLLLAVMLLIIVAMLGVVLLVASGKVVLPISYY